MPIDGMTIGFYVGVLVALWILYYSIAGFRGPRLRYAAVAEGPRCQGCGYILYEGGGENCPECGERIVSDRRILERPAPPTPPVAMALGIAVVLFPVVVAVGYPVAAALDQVWRGETGWWIKTSEGFIIISATVEGRGANRRTDGIELHVQKPSGMRDFWVDPTYRRIWLPKSGPVAINRAGILHARGIELSGANAYEIAEADEVVRDIDLMINNQWNDSYFGWDRKGRYLLDPDDRYGPFFWLPSYAGACVPVWLIVSVVFGWRLFRRYRRRMMAHREKWMSAAS